MQVLFVFVGAFLGGGGGGYFFFFFYCSSFCFSFFFPFFYVLVSFSFFFFFFSSPSFNVLVSFFFFFFFFFNKQGQGEVACYLFSSLQSGFSSWSNKHRAHFAIHVHMCLFSLMFNMITQVTFLFWYCPRPLIQEHFCEMWAIIPLQTQLSWETVGISSQRTRALSVFSSKKGSIVLRYCNVIIKHNKSPHVWDCHHFPLILPGSGRVQAKTMIDNDLLMCMHLYIYIFFFNEKKKERK